MPRLRARGVLFAQQGQPDDEFAAEPGPLASRFDAAAVHADEALHQRQSDAESALRSPRRAIDLHEHVEDLRERVRRNADAVVLHADDRLAALAPGRD